MRLKAKIGNVMLLIAVIGIGLAGLVEWRRQRAAPRLKVVNVTEGAGVVLEYLKAEAVKSSNDLQ